MKPAFEQTPQRSWESFHCEVVRGRSYNATWHFHPEYQITLVLKSNGYRLVGDNITSLRAGDLVLVGSNLPHVWHQDEKHTRDRNAVHAIVVRFLDTFLGAGFLEIPEAEAICRLLKRAKRGLQITGRTRSLVTSKLIQLPASQGLERIAGLLSMLELLARSDETKPIASPGFLPHLSGDDHSRVERVITFMHKHLAEPMDRRAVAAEAHLSAGAFSRFFKLRTGKTFPRYVNELRVGRACRMLADPEIKIADLALCCGFLSLANFNRCFRKIARMSPSAYRRQLRRSSEGS